MRKLAVLLFLTALALTAQLSGRRAPSFSLPDGNFKHYDILDYRGRWLLLDFMTTSCPHCKALSKVLESKKAAWGAKVVVLSVLLPPDNTVTATKYVAETKTTSPMLFDTGQTAMFYFKATPSNPSFDTPHLFAINPSGMIVRDWPQAAVELPGFAAELDATISGAAGSGAAGQKK